MRMTKHVRDTIDYLMQLNIEFTVRLEDISIDISKEEECTIQFRDGVAEVRYKYYTQLKKLRVLQHITTYTMNETAKMCEEIKEKVQ